MKTVIIVHMWDGNPKMNWYPWLKEQLENNGFNVKIPEMPEPHKPTISKWINTLKKTMGKTDEEKILVGHSIGCQTILRYLQREKNQNILGTILVAPWFNLTDKALPDEEYKKTAKPWLKDNIDFNKVNESCDNFIAIFSDNDPYVSLSNCNIFEEKLNAKILLEYGKGHFTEEDNIKELPIV